MENSGGDFEDPTLDTLTPPTPTLRSRSLPGQVLNQAPHTILYPQVLGLPGGISKKLRSLAHVLKGARSRGELVLEIMKQ